MTLDKPEIFFISLRHKSGGSITTTFTLERFANHFKEFTEDKTNKEIAIYRE